jgi:hypothetical protein
MLDFMNIIIEQTTHRISGIVSDFYKVERKFMMLQGNHGLTEFKNIIMHLQNNSD